MSPNTEQCNSPDLSRHMLELALNSLDAGATLVEIKVAGKYGKYTLTVADNGCGMDDHVLARCSDEGFSTKGSTGKGLSQLYAASDGKVKIFSRKGVGTSVTAEFSKAESGDVGASIIVVVADGADVTLDWRVGEGFTFDSRDFKRAFDDISRPETLAKIKKTINHNIRLNGGAML